MAGLTNRETRVQKEVESDEEVDLGNIQEFLDQCKSRKTEERAHGARKVCEFVQSTRVTSGDVLDAILDSCSGALQASRPADERRCLVETAAILMMWGDAPEDFPADFGAALTRSVMEVLKSDEPDVELAKAMLHAITVAQAIEGNSIKLDNDTTVAGFMIKQHIPHVHELGVAYARCLALTCDTEEAAAPLKAILHGRLHAYAEDLVAITGILKCFAVAVEAHGDDFGLQATEIEQYEEASNKLSGGKEAKKELAHVARVVAAFLRDGTTPSETLTLRKPYGSNEALELKLDSFHSLTLIESVRALAGQQYQHIMVFSDVLKHLFDIEDPLATSDGAQQRSSHRRQLDREAQHGRNVAEKARHKGRTAARERKMAGQ